MARVDVPRGRRAVAYLPAPNVVAVHSDGRRQPVVAWLVVADDEGRQEMHGLITYRQALMSAEDAWTGPFGMSGFCGYEVDGAPLEA